MKKGFILLNMGGPNNLDEVEMFLSNMFADPRILPMSPVLRKLIGKRIIKKRLEEARANYRQLGGRSPLTQISQSLAGKVEELTGVPTRLAMRYVPPFAQEALSEFKSSNIDELIVFPMYPQYSTTTTLSSLDDLHDTMERLGYNPKLKVIEPYFSDSDFVEIVVRRIIDSIGNKDAGTYDLILSAHGLPVSIIEAGDPYQEQVESSVDAISKALKSRGVLFSDIRLAYQSKVGNSSWLEPNLTDLLRNPTNTKVLIYPLAFTIDNSETLFELDIEHRVIAEKIGYDDYMVAACPNDGDDFAKFISKRALEAV